jgi:Flp pilus assembly protein TadD
LGDSIAAVRDNLGLALRGQGAYREAEPEHRAALTLRERLFGDDDPRVALTRNNLAHLLLLRGQLREARRLAERARQRCQHEDVSSDQRVNNAFVLARVLWRTGGRSQRVRALDLAKEALRGYQQLGNEREVEALEAWLESRRGHAGTAGGFGTDAPTPR